MKLQDLAKRTFKNSRPKSRSKNMAKKGRKKSRGRKSSSSSTGVFSGKILGFKIPLISDVLKNKTVQKSLAATGLVTTALTIAAFVNNPTVNKVANNEIAQLALAGAAGDVVGVGTQLLRTRGLSRFGGRTMQTGNGNQSLISMSGNGVA